MAATPILHYALTTEPFPLQASPQNGNLTTATLTIVATNPTQNPVTLQGLSVTLPVGNGSTDLTPDATSISPIPPANWTLSDTEPSTGQIKYIFYPAEGHGAVGSEGLNFVFNPIEMNRQTGTVAIEIMEGSNDCTPPDCPTTTLDLTKFPHGWGEVSFSADSANIPYDTSTTLSWDGPQGATYTIDYYTPQTGVVTVPPTGQPPLSSSGQYPGTNAPPLTLEQTTTFTLNVEERINNQSCTAQQQVTVTVMIPAPQIMSFTADPTIIKNGPNTVKLEWKTQNTSKVVITEVSGYDDSSTDLAIDKEHSFVNEQATKGTLWLNPTKSTKYTATAYGLAGYNGQPATATVQVISPPLVTNFTGEIQTSDSVKVSLVLNWEVRYVTECKISGIPETTVPPIGSITITPSVEQPLQTTYTLTAANPAGTVASQLNVVWGKEVLTTTKVTVPHSGPFGMAVLPDATLIFVANRQEHGVSVLDATTLQLVGEPLVNSNPIAWDPKNSSANEPYAVAVSSPKTAKSPFYASNVFVTNFDLFSQEMHSLLVLWTAYKTTPKIKAYANFWVHGSQPGAVAVSPDGTRVYVVNFWSGTLSVIDVESGLLVTKPIPVGQAPTSVAVIPDGSRVFVTNYEGHTVTVIDATTAPPQVLGNPIPVGQGPTNLTISPDGSRLFVVNNLDHTVSVLDATADPIRVIGTPIKVGGQPSGMAITPDGTRVFVASGLNNTVTVLDATANRISVANPSFKVGDLSRISSLAMSPDGARLFVGSPSQLSMVIPTSLAGGIGN